MCYYYYYLFSLDTFASNIMVKKFAYFEITNIVLINIIILYIHVIQRKINKNFYKNEKILVIYYNIIIYIYIENKK